MNFYENQASVKNLNNDDIHALHVEFNSYFNVIVILTKLDIRLYDAMTGKLKKVFNDLYDGP